MREPARRLISAQLSLLLPSCAPCHWPNKKSCCSAAWATLPPLARACADRGLNWCRMGVSSALFDPRRIEHVCFVAEADVSACARAVTERSAPQSKNTGARWRSIVVAAYTSFRRLLPREILILQEVADVFVDPLGPTGSPFTCRRPARSARRASPRACRWRRRRPQPPAAHCP